MLTKPSTLRFFITESRCDIKQLGQTALCKHTMLQISTDSTSCPFRFQCNASSAAVFKGIHFLLHDIRGLSDASLEKNSMFKNRRCDLPDIIRGCNSFADLLDPLSFCHCVSVPVSGTSRSLCNHVICPTLSYDSAL